MVETFRLVRIFLASPGDLKEERRMVRETEEELNNGIAAYLNFRIELKGWEDTLSSSGRPQTVINKELDSCEFFIGLISKRWGTPPSSDGIYSSGFEEEYERSSQRRKTTGKPEMAMYFKKIDSEFLEDQGADLKKVLEFKERLANKREIYYEEFGDPYELQKRVRLRIQEYLINLSAAEDESQDQEKAKTRESSEEVGNSADKGSTTSPFSAEGYGFLKSFLTRTETQDSTEEITNLDVARFRLLSSTISQPGNDNPFLGAHDANIIYSNKHLKYGSKEVLRLMDCALKNISHENIPFWYWYDIYKEVNEDILVFRSLYTSDENVSVGAFKIMGLIGSKLPVHGKHINRRFFIDNWLSTDRANNVKLAALHYLKLHGKEEDIPLMHSELDRANSITSRIALEGIISTQFRYNKTRALKVAFANQFNSFDEILLKEILSASITLDEETLRSGLKHNNKTIRLESFKRLRRDNLVNTIDIQDLKNDPVAQIRKEALFYLSEFSPPLNDEEAKRVLIKPKERGALGGVLSSGRSDAEGQVCFDEYLFAKYSSMSIKELLEIAKNSSIYDDIPYFTLCRRDFKNHSEELRKNVDCKFEGKFEAYIECLEELRVQDELIQKNKDVKDYLKRKLTRKALNVLCEKNEIKDLDRIRNGMRSEYVKSSEDEIEYFRKLGEWEDIPFILKAEQDRASSPSLVPYSSGDDWHCSKAKAIYNIGKDRLDELLTIEMPARILAHLIKTCSRSKFSEISDKTLLGLLNKKEDTTRKFASLKSVQSFNKTKIAALLQGYVDSPEYQYYNVIYWLDFGATMPKSIVRKAINIAFEE
ncbi:MAG: DUF4062 domain-containing protein [Porticoccaceae bacterium]|nr:DUF4062 domain-containing protein [Porticoccaceae bacterium]